MKTLEELKGELLENPEVKREYDAMEPEFSLARELVRARAAAGKPLDESNLCATSSI